MNAPEEKPLPRGHHVYGRAIKVHLSLAERLRAARGVPQAVVKVASYSKGVTQTNKLLKYISRNGELVFETETGEEVRGIAGQKSLTEEWALRFDKRTNGKDVVHLVFSMPRGSDPEALRRAVRTVMTNRFKDHSSVFTIHEDRGHPHAHAAVVMRSGRGKKLRLNKEACYELREHFAAAAREQGIELGVSPRSARGVGTKAIKLAAYHAKQRGEAPLADRTMIQEAWKNPGGKVGKPWDVAMRERHAYEKKAYAQAAAHLRQQAPKFAGQARQTLEGHADTLDAFGKNFPVPQTRRDAWVARVQESQKQRVSRAVRDKIPEGERDV